MLDQSASSQGPDDEGGDGQGDADPDRSHHLVHEVGNLKQIQSPGEKQNCIVQFMLHAGLHFKYATIYFFF